MRWIIPGALALVSCGVGDEPAAVPALPDEDVEEETEEETEAPPEVELIDESAWLVRASLDLRGVRPSPDELRLVAEDPLQAEELIEEMLEDPRLPARMAWLWNDVLHTAVFGADYQRFRWSEEQWRAVGQEPLQIIATVISEDRPFTDILTSQQTRANGVLADVNGLTVSGSDWQWTEWTDARPRAGVVTTNALWLRNSADAINLNRARANALAGIFLCADFLERESDFRFVIGAESLAEVELAVEQEPACTSCHSSLDPLAGYFGGFAERSDEQPQEDYLRWSPILADWYATQSPPSYFGLPAADLGEVGELMASDPRFARCATRRFQDGLVGHAVDDEAGLDQLTADFVASGFLSKDLIGTIVRSDAYRAAEERILTTEQLHTVLAELLDLDPDGLADKGLGPLSWAHAHRVLGGGTDDVNVVFRNRNLGLAPQVLLAWVSRQVVPEAVEAELSTPLESRRLLNFEVDDRSEATVRQGLAELHALMLSELVEVDSEEIDRLYELWTDLDDPGEPAAAWEAVVMALVRHPAQVVY